MLLCCDIWDAVVFCRRRTEVFSLLQCLCVWCSGQLVSVSQEKSFRPNISFAENDDDVWAVARQEVSLRWKCHKNHWRFPCVPNCSSNTGWQTQKLLFLVINTEPLVFLENHLGRNQEVTAKSLWNTHQVNLVPLSHELQHRILTKQSGSRLSSVWWIYFWDTTGDMEKLMEEQDCDIRKRRHSFSHISSNNHWQQFHRSASSHLLHLLNKTIDHGSQSENVR